MASETSVKNADGVEIWYNFDSSDKTVSVTYKGKTPYTYDDEYIGNVVIPSKVTYDGEEYSVTSIGNNAFYGCSSLTSITIPEGVTEIGDYAFFYCSSLTSITIPEVVTSIGGGAFYDCSSLTSITIPEGVTEIGGAAFVGCSSLTSIDVALDNNSYTSINGVLFSKDKTILIKYPEGKKDVTSYAIPESVTKIGEYAFFLCSSLTSITLSEGVTSIGGSAFDDCSSLTSITNMNATPPSIGHSFVCVNKSIPVYVPKQSVEAYKSAKYWNDFTNIVGKFLVVTAIAENGTVTGAGVYEENEEVTLIATPDEGYTFVKWEDGNTNATREVTVNGDATYTATFAINQHTLTVTSNGNGTVLGSGTYDYGTKVTIKATAEDNYHFVKWSDGNTNATREVTVEADATYTATFAVDQYTISVSTDGNGTVSGTGSYGYGSTATLVATPKTGYYFAGWSDGETSATRTFTVISDVELTAVFESNSSVTPISDVVADSVSIRLIGNSLIVEGAESYAVYALSGQCLGKVESLERGVYIVVVDGVSKKIVVK